MDNQTPDQLPILPDPLENQPTPALPAPASPMANPAPVVATTPASAGWLKNKYLKFGIGLSVTVAVFLLVIFGQKIGELFNLFGTKAGQSVDLNSDNFLTGDWTGVPNNNYFQVVDGKLMLNNPGSGQ